MSYYKKINKYLLEHFPLLWNTNLVWMVPIGVTLNIFFYLFGYLITNTSVLTRLPVDDYFFKSGVSYIFYITAIIIVVVWLLRFYKHNPFKYFYPVKKTYFYSLFIQVFVILFLLSLGNYSFTLGAYAKTKKLLDVAELEKDRRILNLAYPFLVKDLDNYKIDKRCYPAPFPLQLVNNVQIEYTENEQVDIAMPDVVTIDTDAEYNKIFHRVDFSKPYIKFDKEVYQFCTYKTIVIDSCKSKTEVDSIYDVSKVYGINKYSMFNYCTTFISNSDTNYTTETHIVPVIHKWLVDKKVDSIQLALSSFAKICDKYKVRYKFDPKVLANLALNLDMNELKTGLVTNDLFYSDTYSSNEYESDKYLTNALPDAAHGEGNFSSNPDISAQLQLCKKYGVDFSGIQTLYTNSEKANTNYLGTDIFWVIVFGCIILAILILAGKFTTLVEILIAVVIAGVLLLLYFFVFYSMLRLSSRGSNLYLGTLIYLIVIAALSWLIIFSRFFNKWIKDKAMLIFYFSLPVCFTVINFLIHYSSRYYVFTCNQKVEHYSYNITQLNSLIAILLSLIPAFYLVRKWKAIKE